MVANDEKGGDGPRVLVLPHPVCGKGYRGQVLQQTLPRRKRHSLLPREVHGDVAQAFWRSGRKKGGYVRPLSRTHFSEEVGTLF